MLWLDRDKHETEGLIRALYTGTPESFWHQLEWWDTLDAIRALPETPKGEQNR